MIYIFDIDGTLADLSHRLHFIQGKKKDWTAFFANCENDKPIPEIIEVCRALYRGGHDIVYATGRSNEIEELTRDWIQSKGLPPGPILMRKSGDHREDNVVKSELLDQILCSTLLSGIAGVFEDREQVVKMYRARGLRVFQVAEGKF